MSHCLFCEAEDEFGRGAPLTEPCIQNRLDDVKDYISSLPPNRVFEEINHKDITVFGDTPLILAATYGHLELVTYLLENGARKDVTTYRGNVYDQMKKKHDDLKGRSKRNVDTHSDERMQRTIENIFRFEEEHPEIDTDKRDKLAKVLKILEAHTDPTHVCTVCHSPNDIMQCSRCHAVLYCSKECQVYDWKRGHKKVCKPAGTNAV